MKDRRKTCEYCGLTFSGVGFCPDDEQIFCCYGCYLVQRIMGTSGDEGVASWMIVKFGIGAFLAMNVMMISIVLYVHTTAELGASAVEGLRWALLALSTPAVIILGGPFVLGVVRDIRRGKLTMDFLILTGSGAAYGVSAFHVVQGTGHIYFDTATMLLAIITLGRLLEASAKSKTSGAIRDFVELKPSVARVMRNDEENEITSDEVEKGDVLIVRPGERIPADGRIVSGKCLVEESEFTGEARPRACAEGDIVFGGSVNCDGLIKVEVTAVGADALLAQVQEIVRRAQSERAPVELLAARVATFFVPVVWAVALGAVAYWGFYKGDFEAAGLSALAVLVVACPCALGLATPMATCLAIGRAAHSGVLVSSGRVLERLPDVRRIFFDKTGTLTERSLQVAGIYLYLEDVDKDAVLTWAAPVEAASEHAIAKAIVRAAKERDLPKAEVTDFAAVPGMGVRAVVELGGESRTITIGSLELLAEEHKLPEHIELDLITSTFVGWNREVVAAILLQEQLRADAKDVVVELSKRGIASAVISGDKKAPTARIAEYLGIQAIFSECKPTDKANVIRKARESADACVAMVGDGINDAPALAEADIGISIGSGTDLARESSDVTLLGDDLSRIPETLELARMTYRVIRQNLLWAFGYNSIAITLAFFGFVHPLIAATAMFASSLSVISNSMRVSRWKP